MEPVSYTHLDKLPPEYQANIEEDGVERSICDYIACMTDRYALALFEELFVPKTWQLTFLLSTVIELYTCLLYTSPPARGKPASYASAAGRTWNG